MRAKDLSNILHKSCRSEIYVSIKAGYNPVYAGTSRRHPTYVADNFLFAIQPDGSLAAYTCDYARQCSAVSIERIK